MDDRFGVQPTVAQWLKRQLAMRELSRRTVLGGIGT
jgi:hypothetical protein